VRDFVNGKSEEIEKIKPAPHLAYSATFFPREKAKNFQTASRQKDKIFK
jgi:hypothetical protein